MAKKRAAGAGNAQETVYWRLAEEEDSLGGIRTDERVPRSGATGRRSFPQVRSKTKNLDLVSSVLCGREKSLSLDIKMHPIFPLFPEL